MCHCFRAIFHKFIFNWLSWYLIFMTWCILIITLITSIFKDFLVYLFGRPNYVPKLKENWSKITSDKITSPLSLFLTFKSVLFLLYKHDTTKNNRIIYFISYPFFKRMCWKGWILGLDSNAAFAAKLFKIYSILKSSLLFLWTQSFLQLSKVSGSHVIGDVLLVVQEESKKYQQSKLCVFVTFCKVRLLHALTCFQT